MTLRRSAARQPTPATPIQSQPSITDPINVGDPGDPSTWGTTTASSGDPQAIMGLLQSTPADQQAAVLQQLGLSGPSPDTSSSPQDNSGQDQLSGFLQNFLNALSGALGGGGGGGSSGPSTDAIQNAQMKADLLRNSQWAEGQQFQDYLTQLGLRGSTLQQQLGFLPTQQQHQTQGLTGQLAASGAFTGTGSQNAMSDLSMQQQEKTKQLQDAQTTLGLTQHSQQIGENLYQNQLANQLQSLLNSWGQFGVH